MKIRTKLKVFLMLSIIFFSCSTNDDGTFEEKNQPDFSSKSKDFIIFKYDGITYSSTFKYSEDSTIIFDNNNIEEIYNKLNQLPELATYIHKDGTIELFENSEILEKEIVKQMRLKSEIANSFPNSPTTNRMIDLFVDKDCTGRYMPFQAGEYPDLNAYNFNDMLTSFKLYRDRLNNRNTTVILYRDGYYQGNSISFSCTDGDYRVISNLKNYKISGGFVGIGKINWNDRVSSFKVFYN